MSTPLVGSVQTMRVSGVFVSLHFGIVAEIFYLVASETHLPCRSVSLGAFDLAGLPTVRARAALPDG
jgi:hypothetical protein